MKIKFNSFEITFKEILFSLIILCLALCLGIILNNKIDEHFTIKEEKYNKALKINNDNEQFVYAINTNVGNLINYGKFEVVSPIKDDWLINSYTAYKKITERYTMHTRTECSGSGNDRECHTETYYTWDEININTQFASELYFSSVIFSTSHFTNYQWQNLNISSSTIKSGVGYLKNNYIYKENRIFGFSVGDLRYYYEIVPSKFYGTTFGVAINNTYISENNNQISISNKSLDEFIKSNKSSKTIWKILFWILYVIIVGLVLIGFYYYENDWLE